MNLGFLLFGVLTEAAPVAGAAESAFVLRPLLVQNAVLFRSKRVTAGGLGGGVGLELEYRERYLLQVDTTALFSLGNTLATHLAAGVQRRGFWRPAAWLGAGALWGDRLEFLTNDGARPAIPTWALGLRGAPLRFGHEFGVFSVTELGVATDFAGGSWLELTVLRAGIGF